MLYPIQKCRIIFVKLYLRVDEKLSPAHTPTLNWMASPSLFDLLFGHVQMGSAEDGHGYVTGPFPHLFTRNIHGKRLPVLALSPYTNIFCEAPLPPPQRG